jgi:hypothetical protein
VPVVVPSALGVLVWVLGHPTRAVALWAIAALVLILVLIGVPVERYVARFAAWVAHGVGVVASVFVGLLLLVAGGIVKILGRDPLTPKGRRGNSWQPTPSSDDAAALATAPFGLEHLGSARSGGARSLGRSCLIALGSVTALLIVDLGIGLAWERVSAPSSPAAAIADAVNFTGRTDTVADIRAELPAMEAYPWADEYFREIQQTPNSYWPFTESRPIQFDGEYVTINDDWSRASYEPDDLPDDAPVVWMFGGSTTWGEGQRDEHTIASELARLAEDDGTPIRVVNYGQRGWTHFQEMILFEQLLAEGPPPDVALFYDGANEINAQSLGPAGVPTHTLAGQYAEKLTGQEIAEFEDADVMEPPSAAAEAWDAYLAHSAIQKAVRRLRDVVDPPAGASNSTASQEDDGPQDLGQNFVKTTEHARAALDVYGRGTSMSSALAEEYGVEPLFFWQPVMAGEAELWANARVSAPTINISDALDLHGEVYIDGGHTNEVGARVVAERIWPELSATLATGPASGRRSSVDSPAPATPQPEQAAPPSAVDRLASATSMLDRAEVDPCDLGDFSNVLGTLRAPTEEDRGQLVALVQRYLRLLAGAVPSEDTQLSNALAAASEQLAQQMAVTTIDPDLPALFQLPIASAADLPAAIQAAEAALLTRSSCT